MDRRDPDAKVGKMWFFLVSGGSMGRSSSDTCVEFIVSLFGNRT